MELNRALFGAIIFDNFLRGLTQQQCIDELNSIFGDEAPSRTSVYRWYGEFNRGRSSLQDEFREGRPKSVVAPETIDAVIYREIETTLGISGTSIHSIMHEHLTVKKIGSPWIPHNLSIAQKNQSMRVSKVLRQLVQSKRMQKCINLNGEYFEKQ